jgi:hypothetical protein
MLKMALLRAGSSLAPRRVVAPAKFDRLPCIDKRELPTGGIFFTTAERPDEFHRPKRTREQEIDLARRHFEAVGMTLESVEGDVLIFRDEQGGVTRIDIGEEGRIDTWPSGGR